MSRQLATAVLSIPNAQTKSGSIQGYWDSTNAGKVAMQAAASITIKAPAALTAVVTVQVAMTEPSADADFVNLQQGGADLTIAAGKAVTITHLGAKDLRLISAGAEGAQRDFFVTLQEDIG